jgi:hypothetical protein
MKSGTAAPAVVAAGPHLPDQLVGQQAGVGAVFGVTGELDRGRLQGDQRKDAEREDEDRDQRFEQHDAGLRLADAGVRSGSCAGLRIAGRQGRITHADLAAEADHDAQATNRPAAGAGSFAGRARDVDRDVAGTGVWPSEAVEDEG